MTADTSPKPRSKIGVTESIALAGLPFAAYAAAFLYERAFATKYGFPTELIKIAPTSILVVIGIVVIVGLHVYLMLAVLPKRAWLAPVRLILPLFAGFFLVILLRTPGIFGANRRAPWFVWVPILAITVLSIAIALVQPILKYSGHWTERWARAFMDQSRAHPETAFFGVMDNIVEAGFDLRSWMRVYWIVFGTLFISYWSGRFVADRQRDFLVSAASDDLVVLRTYGDNFVCATFDRRTRMVRREFRVIPVTGEPFGPWRRERVGPLRAAAFAIQSSKPQRNREESPALPPAAVNIPPR